MPSAPEVAGLAGRLTRPTVSPHPFWRIANMVTQGQHCSDRPAPNAKAHSQIAEPDIGVRFFLRALQAIPNEGLKMTRDDFLTEYIEYKWRMQLSIAIGSLFLYSALLLAVGSFLIGSGIFPSLVIILTGFLIAFYFGNLKPRQINKTFRRKGLPEDLLDKGATTK